MANQTFVLVHGAWHGSWCWHKVARHLQNFGHRVIAPDLPSHGHNHHNAKEIHLRDYVDCIRNLICSIEDPVILVGHSMAGIVITQVAENIPDKIKKLIYVSAFIPENEGSLVDEERLASLSQTTHLGIAQEVSIDLAIGMINLPLPERICTYFYSCCARDDREYALARLQPQPVHPFTEKVFITDMNFGRVPKMYIECLQDKAIRIEDQRRMYGRISCRVATLDTDHSPFFSADKELANLICEK